MRSCLAVLCALTAACGRVDFDARMDATTGDSRSDAVVSLLDSSSACDPATSWGPPQPLTLLNTNVGDWTPALSPDGLRLVFTSNRSGTYDLWMSSRPDTASPFGAPVKISPSTTTDEETDTAWSADGTALFYIQYNATAMTGGNYVVSYLGGTSFGAPMDAGPLVPRSTLSFAADNLELFATDEPVPQAQQLVRYTRATAGAAWVQETDIDVLNVSSAQGWPSIDETRQDLYFERNNATGVEIAVSHRGARGSAFQPAVTVSLGGGGGEGDGDPEVSRDGTTFIFASDRTGGAGAMDLYMATRTCM